MKLTFKIEFFSRYWSSTSGWQEDWEDIYWSRGWPKSWWHESPRSTTHSKCWSLSRISDWTGNPMT